MTYQYLTVEMVKAAKENGGFIDQKTFKTAGKYGFDSVILTKTSMQVLDGYINFVRPLLKPRCNFVFVTKNGGQHSKLGDVMNKLVFYAIGKYVHPHVIVKLSRHIVFESLLAKSTKFCLKIKNIARPSPKFIIKSKGHAKLLRGLTCVCKIYRVPMALRWIRR